MQPLKHSVTVKPYSLKYKGYQITIPEGTPVSNQTACGPDDNYRFVVPVRKLAKEVTGLENSILLHDLTHYGLNVPAEYCQPWK